MYFYLFTIKTFGTRIRLSNRFSATWVTGSVPVIPALYRLRILKNKNGVITEYTLESLGIHNK